MQQLQKRQIVDRQYEKTASYQYVLQKNQTVIALFGIVWCVIFIFTVYTYELVLFVCFLISLFNNQYGTYIMKTKSSLCLHNCNRYNIFFLRLKNTFTITDKKHSIYLKKIILLKKKTAIVKMLKLNSLDKSVKHEHKLI